MSRNNEKHGVIFDLDGTLWDSSYQVGIAWNDALRRNGYDIELTPRDMTVMMGRTVPEIGEIVFPFIELERRKLLLEDCCAEENRRLNLYGGEVFPGVLEGLKRLAEKYPLYIVSNCQDGYIQSFLNYHKASPYIFDIECIGRTGLAKAGNIKLIVDRNHLDKAVYIGDIGRDMRSAEEAGVPFIFAAYGFGDAPDAQMRIERFGELEALLTKVFEEE